MTSTAKTWRDLALVTGLSEPTVKAAIRGGLLPGSKIGKKYVIPAEAFERYVRGEWIARPQPIAPIASKVPAPVLIKSRKAS